MTPFADAFRRVAELLRDVGSAAGGLTFGTPTVVHFGAVLLLSAVLSAPWGGVGVPTAGYPAHARVNQALFGIATAGLLLLFIGIHNAWDTVTYLVFVRKQEQQQEDSSRRT
jgi:hypothetical protein